MAPTRTLTPEQQQVIGSALASFYGSYHLNSDEYNRKLAGQQGYKIFDEMARSDASVNAALEVIKLPIQAADWHLERGDDTPHGQKAYDYVKHNLFTLLPWDEILEDAFTHFDFGFWAGEKVWDFTEFEGQQYVCIRDIEGRPQTSVASVKLEDGSDGIVQNLAAGTKEIPRDKLVMMFRKRRGGAPAGISILRSLYKHWYIKDKIYRIDAIAHERQGLGVPRIKIPNTAGNTEKARAREIARNVRANEEGFVEMPDGYDFEFLDMKANTTRDPMNSVTHHDRQIMKGVLAQFLELGSSGSSGSYNLSVDHSRLFLKSLEASAKRVAATFNKDVVDPLIDMNGWQLEQRPRLTFGKVGDENIDLLAKWVSQLLTSGGLTMDFDIENRNRKALGLPELPEEQRDEYVPPKATPPALQIQSPDGAEDAAGTLGAAKKARATIDELIYGDANSQ